MYTMPFKESSAQTTDKSVTRARWVDDLVSASGQTGVPEGGYPAYILRTKVSIAATARLRGGVDVAAPQVPAPQDGAETRSELREADAGKGKEVFVFFGRQTCFRRERQECERLAVVWAGA